MCIRTILLILISAAPTYAALQDTPDAASQPEPRSQAADIDSTSFHFDPASLTSPPWGGEPNTQVTRPKAISYSHGYTVRGSIHKYASIATLPLFAAQFAVGQKLYNNPGDNSLRSAHSGLAAGTAVLFGLNSVTGVWNLMEGRHDPNGRRRRLIHGILMLTADAGFVATAALAPGGEGRRQVTSPNDRRATHRAVALSSMGVATASYLYMLFTR